MKNTPLSVGGRSHALLIAPLNGKSVEVASFATKDGDQVVCNADIKPYSMVDGSPMQMLSSKKTTISAKNVASMVKIGRCTACDNDLVATASLADAIESAGTQIHCPMCSSEVTASIDNHQLILALAEEFDDSDDDSEEPEEDKGDEDEAGEGDEEPEDEDDSDEDEDPEADEDSDEGDEDDDSDDDEGDESVDDSDEPEDDEEHANEDCDNKGSMDDPNDEEFAKVVASLRKKVVALGMDENTDGDEFGEEAIPDDDYTDDDADAIGDEGEDEDHDDEDNDEDNTEYDDNDVDDAVAAFSKVVAHVLGERPIAGKGIDRRDIQGINDEARAALRQRRGFQPDGNSNLKSNDALASEQERPVTPGTKEVEGEENHQTETPGTNKAAPSPNDTEQDKTPGTEIGGDKVVNWKLAQVEVIATSDANSRWIYADGKPVGQLMKANASEGIASKWDDVKVLQAAFKAVCSRGMNAAEASEFGFVPHTFTVQASDVMRNAMHRQAALATENAQAEIVRGVERYKNSLRSAMIAALKGSYPDLQNPVRDALVASLANLSVAEPRSVVDTAMAKSVEPFLVNVFKKADEIAAKSDDARSEIANFVSTAAYQARVDEGSILAAKLASGTGKILAGGARPAFTPTVAKASDSEDQNTLVRRALRTIR